MDTVTLILVATLIVVLSLIAYTGGNENEDKIKQIPGLNQSQSKNGQIIIGEFSKFLEDLHKRFGTIASFYHNNKYAVSIADPELLKPLRQLEIVSTEMFDQFQIVTGKESFMLQDLEEIKRRRKLYAHHFMLRACKSYTDCFLEIANEYVEKWKKLSKDDHIPLMETTLEATLKGILRTSYGDYFKDEKSLKHFKKLLVNVSLLMEKEIKANSTEEMEMNQNVGKIRAIVKHILSSRERDTSASTDRNVFIDVLLEDGQSTEAQMGDSMLFIMAGYDPTGRLIMWILYELASQPELQEKLYEELKSVLGDDDISLAILPKLHYLGQIVDEIIRYRFHSLFTARIIPKELKLANYVIPANSTLYLPLGIPFTNDKYYTNPEKFDPEHFSAENSKLRNPYAWKPFGYAGKRQCPGQSYARTIISVYLAQWVRQFRFVLVPNQKINIVRGMMLRPEVDILNEDTRQIPGLSPSESKDGQVIFAEFSLYLADLHKRFGPVVSFYQNNQYAVSIAHPDLLKQLRHLEITPTDLFTQFEIVSGKEAFGFQELEEIRRRRKLYDHHFMLKSCKSFSDCFVEIAKEYVEKWKKLGKDHQLRLMDVISEATLKGILRTSYGDYFKDEKSLQHFKKLLVNVSMLLEKQLLPNSPEEVDMKKYVEEINTIVKQILATRVRETTDSDVERNLFIDVLLEDTKSEAAQLADSTIFIMAGYDVTGKTIMWTLYELAKQPELQEKLYEELKSVLGDNSTSLETIPQLQYLGQVIDETIRYRLKTIFAARNNPEDLKLGNYLIPANSRLYLNLGETFMDNKHYANAEKFDPEHFSVVNSRKRHPYAWKPFGFAGKRQCPGQSYVRTKISIYLAEWIRQFRFKLVPDQNLKFVQGMIIRPEDDILVTLEPRH
uniref:Cytochrome P450 n=1 Tax=Strigamia maritima TaxID=126957 RepID=T1JH93_STRMM